MSYNFNTIDGLFRPNYKVFRQEVKTSKPESENSGIEPVIVTYKPENIDRIKSLITEEPVKESVAPESTTEEIEIRSEDTSPKEGQKYFKQELDKFIEENPEYKDIKDSLYRLASLESSYKMDVTNSAGSGALGWFQFMDGTRKQYNSQTRAQFANDPQAQLLAAAQYYTDLQYEIARRGGDPNDFETMYGAWWRPESAYAYLKDPNYDFKTKFGESFQQIRRRARNLVNKDGESYS